ncbi:glutamate racemase [Borreliella yangtzensis]|uniref:Glutamate racemase n=1 Tax=Borreliella yangtzensis TaxID=683292 RepID=A0ABR6PA48_9SPIR|nr:glutamate racemase [Borreliella yangtzensis]MBB6043142.1 glutamate racemase [Borreliella yangtzensis]WKC73095.1 glutamate racemase [Borreliella yangtzensis]WKC74012.1 glutamate racemase [Borreliella yangtzensis]
MKSFKEVIIVFDSGIGGLSYFKYIKSKIEGYQYVYVADNKNFPYGEKSSEYLLQSIFFLIEKLKKIYNIIALVLACNTISVSVYNKLNFVFPVIYTLPEVSSVSDLVLKKVLLIATNTTLESEFVKNQVNIHDDLIIKAAGELVNFVEYGEKFRKDALRCLEALRLEVVNTGREIVFLGCTHYLHLKTMIEDFLKIPVYENRELVVQSLIRSINFFEYRGNYYKNDVDFVDEFYLTKNENLTFYQNFCKKYNLHFKGMII